MFSDRQALCDALCDERLDSLVRAYFRESLQLRLGIEGGSFDDMAPAQTRQVLYRLYAWATIEASGAGGGLNTAAQGAECFAERLCQLDGDALRSVDAWLEHVPYNAPRIKSKLPEGLQGDFQQWTERFSPAQKLAVTLAHSDLRGMKLKTASLFVKVLAKDFRFFTDYNNTQARSQELLVPSDRVNLRMVAYFLGGDGELQPFFSQEVWAALRKNPSESPAFFYMSFLAHRLLGGMAIRLENLWFIGHFYHENMREPSRRNRGERALVANETVYPVCKLRSALVAGDYFSCAGIEPPCDCPFKTRSCTYDRDQYQAALDEARAQ